MHRARSSKRELRELQGRRRFTRADKIALAVTLVVMVPLAVVFAYPFFWMVTSSVKSNVEIFGSLNPFTPTLRVSNYINAWNDANMGQYFFNSVFVTVFSIIISVFSNALMGYALGR